MSALAHHSPRLPYLSDLDTKPQDQGPKPITSLSAFIDTLRTHWTVSAVDTDDGAQLQVNARGKNIRLRLTRAARLGLDGTPAISLDSVLSTLRAAGYDFTVAEDLGQTVLVCPWP